MNNIYTKSYENFPLLHNQELRGTEGMKVQLTSVTQDPYYAMAVGQTASWRPWKQDFTAKEITDMIDGITAGKIWAGQVFEAINFTFLIENISRATTHQLVRIRVGAGFMQESGREGTWDQAQFITPLTILENEDIHKKYVDIMAREIATYSELRSLGIPPQDARMMFGHGVAQNMWMTINFRALQEWCNKRLCTNMGWEINTLARMVRDAVIVKYPHLGVLLKSHCERSGGHKGLDNTNYYAPGAENNGAKVYFEADKVGDAVMCGKAGAFTKDEIDHLLEIEKKELEQKYA